MAPLLGFVVALHTLDGTAKPLQAELAKARAAAEYRGYCADRRSGEHWDKPDATEMRRYRSAYIRAEQIIGAAVNQDRDEALRAPRKPPRCTTRSMASAKREFSEAIDQVGQLTDVAEAPIRKGLWIGLFPVCRQTVETANIVLGKTGHHLVSIRFAKPYDEEFEHYTTAFLADEGVSYPVAVHLNGVLVSRPMVYEPMSAVELSGPPDDALPAILASALSPCSTD